MKGRAWSTLLVMFVGVVLAAALQEFCAPVGALRLKPPLLLGVAVYYAMRREAGWGLLAAVWCGVLEDGLGPVPGGASLLAFAGVWALCVHVVRPQVEEGAPSCAAASVSFGNASSPKSTGRIAQNIKSPPERLCLRGGCLCGGSLRGGSGRCQRPVCLPPHRAADQRSRCSSMISKSISFPSILK